MPGLAGFQSGAGLVDGAGVERSTGQGGEDAGRVRAKALEAAGWDEDDIAGSASGTSGVLPRIIAFN